MSTYRVVWEIDIEAESPEDAAREARNIQLDPTNCADHFEVLDEYGVVTVVDVLDLCE